MATVSLATSNVREDGGDLFRDTYTGTDTIRSKVLLNRAFRPVVTFYCSTTEAGTFTVYDVDSAGETNQLYQLVLTGADFVVFTANLVMYGAYCTWEPGAGTGTQTLIIRALPGGARF